MDEQRIDNCKVPINKRGPSRGWTPVEVGATGLRVLKSLRRLQRALVGLAVVQSGKPRKSWERKRSKRLKGQQPERKEKYRERHYRANPKQHHKLSKPSAKASIKILGFVFTRIVLPARELNDRAVLFSHLVSYAEPGAFDGERARPVFILILSHSRSALG